MNETSSSQVSLRQFFGKLRSSSSRSRSSTRYSRESSPSAVPSSPISRTSSSVSLGGSLSKYGKRVDTLGSGISSKVDLYYKKQTDEYYAVKVFRGRENYESKDEYRHRCNQEYEITKNLNHKNIARSFAFFTSLSGNQLVMEFSPYPLLKVIQFATPSEYETLCFFRQICEGVDYLHRNYIAHRDLKLENIQMNETGTIKLIDFGTAFVYGQEKKPAVGAVGTEGLISPEALSKLEYDGEMNDIWALGIVLYSMLNISFPWKAARLSDPDFKHFLSNQDTLKDQYPEEIWPLVIQILQVDPLNRIMTRTILHHLSTIDSVCPHSQCPPKRHAKTLRICANRFKFKTSTDSVH